MNTDNSERLSLVSIAVCTYNGEKYLREQLESLVNQSYPSLEIIVVDDCSEDNTTAILKEYQTNYSFFTYYENDVTLGYVKNFEKAIGLCSGDYIALSDQDDIWDLGKISLQMASIGNHALIYHDSALINENGIGLPKKLSDIYTLYEGNMPQPFMFYNCVSGHSILFSKKIVQDLIPFPKNYFHDRWIALIASERGGIKLLRLQLVKYRQHIFSTTDLLKIKITAENKADKFFDKNVLNWVAMCKDKSVYNQNYFKSFLSCFDEQSLIVKRLKLFVLLYMKKDLIFYTIKKSNFSRINYLRKICFVPKHS